MTLAQTDILRTSTPDLVAGEPSSWTAWTGALHVDQHPSRPITPEEVDDFRQRVFSRIDPCLLPGLTDFIQRELTMDRLIAEVRYLPISAGRPNLTPGLSLLSSMAPTPFMLDRERFMSIENFHQALKFPAESIERTQCASASPREAKRMARKRRADSFIWNGVRIPVGSADHRHLFARALCGKIDQNPEVESALKATAWARLAFPLTYASGEGIPARITGLVFMLERLRRWGSPAGPFPRG